MKLPPHKISFASATASRDCKKQELGVFLLIRFLPCLSMNHFSKFMDDFPL